MGDPAAATPAEAEALPPLTSRYALTAAEIDSFRTLGVRTSLVHHVPLRILWRSCLPAFGSRVSFSMPMYPETLPLLVVSQHVHLKGVCSAAEVAAYCEVISDKAYGVWDDAGATGQGRHFLQTLNLRHRHPGIMQYVLAERFGRIVAELIGCDAVRIFHEQALFKEGGGGLTPLVHRQSFLGQSSAGMAWVNPAPGCF